VYKSIQTIKELKIQYVLGTINIYDIIQMAGDNETPKCLLKDIWQFTFHYINSEVLPLNSTEGGGVIEIVSKLSSNPSTPSDVLVDIISKTKSTRICKALTENPRVPKEILIKLSNHYDRYVRRGVGYNFNTPEEVLIKLSKDKDTHVRGAVAHNLNTPIKILIELSKESVASILGGLLRNPNTPRSKIKAFAISEKVLNVIGYTRGQSVPKISQEYNEGIFNSD